MLERKNLKRDESGKPWRPTVSFAIEKINECEIHEYTNGNWLIIGRGEKRTEKKFGVIKGLTTLKGKMKLTLTAVSDTSIVLEKLDPPRSRGSSSKKDGQRLSGAKGDLT